MYLSRGSQNLIKTLANTRVDDRLRGAPIAGARPCIPGVAFFASKSTSLRDYPPMRNILVPQTGHVPWVAGLPFFMVMRMGLRISRFALHFTQ